MPEPTSPTPLASLRDFIYLDADRVDSLAAQLRGPQGGAAAEDATPADLATRAGRERQYLRLEPALLARPGTLRVEPSIDFATWVPETFVDGRFVVATGVVRLFDFTWLSAALGGLPAVLKKMSKLEMDALRASDEGRRMSKAQLQQRSQENQVAITRVEEFKADELGDVVRRLYGDAVRVKVRPDPAAQPAAALVGSARAGCFYDPPAALSQKYGIEVDAGWTAVGQLNVPKAAAAQPVPTGNRMEDAFEQIAVLMNNAFRMASAPAWPAVSFTPIAIYRTTGA